MKTNNLNILNQISFININFLIEIVRIILMILPFGVITYALLKYGIESSFIITVINVFVLLLFKILKESTDFRKPTNDLMTLLNSVALYVILMLPIWLGIA